jgi:hypothetical protein
MAVHKALAIGYLSIIEGEGRGSISFHPERNTKDIWEFWVTCCRVELEA